MGCLHNVDSRRTTQNECLQIQNSEPAQMVITSKNLRSG